MFIVIRKSIANKANHRNPRDIRRIGRDQRSESKRIPLPSPPRYIFGATKNSHLERLTI